MSSAHVMKVSGNGQVSLPAETRRRWDADRVVVVDMGDYVIVRPADGSGRASLHGKYEGRLPSIDEMRRRDRDDDAACDSRSQL